MTSSLSATIDTDTHSLLTGDAAARITAAIDASHAETTRTVCACAWRAWMRWCVARGVGPLGGTTDYAGRPLHMWIKTIHTDSERVWF